jgi:DNA-binding protein HU-beta
MTKAEIVDRIARATGLTKLETEAVVAGFLYTVIDTLKSGEEIELRGFGSFRVKKRAPRMARNPKTSAEVPVPAQHVPVFKVSKSFRAAVDEALSE